MPRSVFRILVFAVAWTAVQNLGAASRTIDTEHSTLTVFVYKSGLFSALADDHVIDAKIASGSISEEAPQSIAVEVRSADLRVRDPNLSEKRRDEVQMRMLGPEVLDAARYPMVTFESTSVEVKTADRFEVTGRLTIHGQTRALTLPVDRVNGRYRGSVKLKQTDYGIAPINIAGGSVKVRDEIRIDFDVAVK